MSRTPPTFLSAYTPISAGLDQQQVPFVNFSANDDDLFITMRRAGSNNIGFTPIEMVVPKDEAILLLKDALLRIMDRDAIRALAQELIEGTHD